MAESARTARTTEEALERIINTESNDNSIVRPEVTAIEAITRSEVAMQLDCAHRWPRSVAKFLKDATELATFSVEIAESCFYSVPRAGDIITGPSVRLAEMCADCWGNLHVGSRVVDETATEIIAQAVAWDLERNVRYTVEASRSIVGRAGRFSDDMIRVTGMAAISIALRNVVFRVIPRAYVTPVYEKAKKTAVGDAETFVSRRTEVLARLTKMGITTERIFARLNVRGPTDIHSEQLETLIGLGSAIRQKELTIDAAFPAVVTVSASKGSPVLDQMVTAQAKAATGPTGATGKVEPSQMRVNRDDLYRVLIDTDERWGGLRARVDGWDELQALTAAAYLKAIASDAPQGVPPEMPAHLRLDRMPGEDG